jgi:hypothetical protein
LQFGQDRSINVDRSLYAVPETDLAASTFHEVGRGVAAHASGRHVIDVTIERDLVLPGGVTEERDE